MNPLTIRALIHLAFLLPFVPAMYCLSRLHGEAVPLSFVNDLDEAWSTLFPE